MSNQEEETRLKAEAARVVEIARQGGADTAVVSMQQKSEFQVEVRNGEIENLSEADFRSFSLTVSKGGRRASVSSCDLARGSIEGLVSQALDMCKYTDEDPFYTLPDPDLQATEDLDLDLFDEQVEAISVQDKIARVMALEKALLGQSDVLKSEGASLSTVAGTSALANSQGFCMARTASLIYLSTSAFAEDEVGEGDLNTGRKQTGGWASRARHVADLEPAEEIAAIAASRVLRKLGARKPPSGNFPIYFEPSLARGLWSHLLTAISGTQIYRHESYLEDREGKAVCAKEIQILDDPTLQRGLASRVFDAEGIACNPCSLIEDGILQTYIMGTYSAKKLGKKPVGHGGGSSNLLVRPGDLSEAEMIRKMGRGVWLTSLLGQGVNISSGDYSRGASGLWVENGEVQYPIMEFTVNSNLDQMFQNLIMVGNNVEKGSSMQTPGLVVGDMVISGG